ncbi:MAG: hypothetical protein J0I99_10690 [Devosia sp.]|uniref:hypothetical protein n=1 Tax=Devosia sp. TaxID=1871048 RepID=UPI001ACE4DAD|nr:hypothetical protein [Devosia sp.]MBN9316197.1 hypothetical protein [Devosia sp.]
MANKQTAIAVVVVGGILALASLAEAYAEITPYFLGGIGAPQRFRALVTGAFIPGDSRWSRDLYLDECLDVPSAIYALAQPTASRRRLLLNCSDNAGRIVASAPTTSSAWLVLAMTAAERRDYSAMRQALAMSKRTAPKLQWLADRRTQLVEAHPDQVDAAGRAVYEDDLAVLATGRMGIEVLAQRYVRRADLRDTYTRILELAPPDRQRAFLALVTQRAADK